MVEQACFSAEHPELQATGTPKVTANPRAALQMCVNVFRVMQDIFSPIQFM